MSEEMISLFELLDLAIGTPQKGSVNFSALHALLHAVLRQLHVQETPWGAGGGGEEEQVKPGESDVSPGEQEPQEPGATASSRTREDREAQVRHLNPMTSLLLPRIHMNHKSKSKTNLS